MDKRIKPRFLKNIIIENKNKSNKNIRNRRLNIKKTNKKLGNIKNNKIQKGGKFWTKKKEISCIGCIRNNFCEGKIISTKFKVLDKDKKFKSKKCKKYRKSYEKMNGMNIRIQKNITDNDLITAIKLYRKHKPKETLKVIHDFLNKTRNKTTLGKILTYINEIKNKKHENKKISLKIMNLLGY